jgi:hypothetical protein
LCLSPELVIAMMRPAGMLPKMVGAFSGALVSIAHRMAPLRTKN